MGLKNNSYGVRNNPLCATFSRRIYKFTLKHCILSGSFYWELIVWFTTVTPSIYIYMYICTDEAQKAETVLSAVSYIYKIPQEQLFTEEPDANMIVTVTQSGSHFVYSS